MKRDKKILLIFAETTASASELVNTKCKQHNFEVPNKLMAPSKFDAKIYINRAHAHKGRRTRPPGGTAASRLGRS